MMAAVYLILLAFYCAGVSAELPKEWFECQSNSSDFTECLKKSFTLAAAYFKNGNEEYEIEPLDPLEYPAFESYRETGPFPVYLIMSNVTLEGLSDVNIISIDISTVNETTKYIFIFNLTNFIEKGNYFIEGKAFGRDIYGTGKFVFTWENTQFKLEVVLKEIEIDGKKYYQIENMPVDFETNKITYNFNNLYDGDKSKGDEMNQFLTDNWEKVIATKKDNMKKYYEIGLTDYFNAILENIPVDTFHGK